MYKSIIRVYIICIGVDFLIVIMLQLHSDKLRLIYSSDFLYF